MTTLGPRVGVDIGGTFTDVVVIEPHGAWRMAKVRSTPPTYVEGVIQGIREAGIAIGDIGFFAHGTTVGTNAVLERKGAKTGLITTRGFEDVLEVARETWAVEYDYWWQPPPPLVHRLLRQGVIERVSATGEIVQPLDEDSVQEAIALLRDRGVEALAVCLLHSYVNPAHEQRVRDIARRVDPRLPIYLSSEMCPEVGEFERSSTTVVSALVGPRLDHYLEQVKTELGAAGYHGDVLVMNSAGGVMSVDAAREAPVQLLLSGLAAGVMAGVEIARQTGEGNLITLDIGGTSADMALIHHGRPRLVPEWEVSFNVPVKARAVDVHTIGAGGGSIAWIDRGGALKVGPQSAGASPGPVCYGRGGEAATVTDALLVLGHVIPEVWAAQYGWHLDLAGAIRAIETAVGEPLGLARDAAADAVREVLVHNLVQAVRLVSIERGYDPRDFRLVAYGGAGPLLAADVARELHIPSVYVPLLPGVTSAMGLLQCDLRIDAARSVARRSEGLDFPALNRLHDRMVEDVVGQFAREGMPREAVTIDRQVDIRNYGQARYITVTMDTGERLSAASWDRLLERFDEIHRREYGYVMPLTLRQRELANLRVVGICPIARPAIEPTRANPGARPIFKPAAVHFRGHGRIETAILWRDELPIEEAIAGPAVVVQADSTTVIPPGMHGAVDRFGNLKVMIDG